MKRPMFIFLILISLMLVITETSFTYPASSERKNIKKSDLHLFNGKNLNRTLAEIKLFYNFNPNYHAVRQNHRIRLFIMGNSFNALKFNFITNN